MLRNLTKGWYLCSHKYQRILMYKEIFILLKSAFLLKEIQQSSIFWTKRKKEIEFLITDILNKASILTKPTKNLVIVASSL